MSYRWRRTSAYYRPPRYSFQLRFKDNAVGPISMGRPILNNRFRYRRVNGGFSVASTKARPVIPYGPPRRGIVPSRGNLFKTVSPRTIKRINYVAHSRLSIFKYRSKSWIANKSKLKSHSKALTSKNPFVFQKTVCEKAITPAHLYRLSVKRAINMNRRFIRQICPDYVKTGSCESADNCPLRHESNYLRICPKFLQNICLIGEHKCPLAHVLDPCRIPQCIYYAKGTCTRSCCSFLHVKYPQGTYACPNFLIGRCEKGSSCKKRHIWRGELDANKNEKSKSVSQPEANNDDVIQQSEHLGSLRNVKVVPEFIPFYVSDD